MYLHRHGSEGEIVAQKNVATLLVVIAGRGVIQPLDDSFKPLEVSFSVIYEVNSRHANNKNNSSRCVNAKSENSKCVNV